MEEEEDLSDVVLSWSIQDILYGQQQVEKIPSEFDSLDSYFKSYVAPLIEETRSEISISLEVISEAPYSEILSMEAMPRSSYLLYNMDLDSGYISDSYMARAGDILILSSSKPEAAEYLIHYGATLVMVTEVSMDGQHQNSLRMKVAKDILTEQNKPQLKYAMFAANITTNIRIWNALCSHRSMNKNYTIIQSLLSPKYMGGSSADICAVKARDSLSYLVAELMRMRLNGVQLDTVASIISAVQCKHSNLMKLIWGPPGTGKTKTICATLWALKQLKYRTLLCAPTNISVLGVCYQLLQSVKDFDDNADANSLPCSLGDVVLFGNKYKMDITKELHEVFLDYRVDELVKCFSSSSGWRHVIDSVISLLENHSYEYNMLPDDVGHTGPPCSLEFLKQFSVVANDLKDCIVNLWVHLPQRCFSSEIVSNILNIMDLLKIMQSLLSCEDQTNDYSKRAFHLLSLENSGPTKAVTSVNEWVKAVSECLKLLKFLKCSLVLPTDVSKSWTRNYCMQNAVLIFCTVSSSFHLHHMEIATVDVLIIDEAAQVRECETVIPLSLHGLRHAILVGDDFQLQPVVRSHVCRQAGLGVSLFKRLTLLGFEKCLLNMQYRMHPSISLFPNALFYDGRIIDGSNVKCPSYNKDYLDLPFGNYTFLNIVDGKEEREGSGKSWRNMVEVAVILHLIQTIFKSWNNMQKITIGVVSPYSSQVNAVKVRLGTKYDNYANFNVRVKCIDGFQGEEDDIIILSTVRSNPKGSIGFLADNQRTNVALTRARHCLWVLGNANALSRSGTVWAAIVHDAEERKCLFNATDNAALARLILNVKAEFDQLGDLLNSGSAAFCNTKWKIIFSNEFRNAFLKLKSAQLRREVLQKLVGLGCGWRSRVKNMGMTDKFELTKVYKVRDLYLIWTTDLEKDGRFFQIIRIWDLVTSHNIERTIRRLEKLFSMYSDNFMEHCKRVCKEGKWEVPIVWSVGHDVTRFRNDCLVDSEEEENHVELSYAVDNSKASESLLLMKFYSLSSGVAKHLLAATDGSKIDIPFEMTEQEKEIIQYPCTSFILGRSGTGKTTVLTMKLIQKEQQSLIACQGLSSEEDNLSDDTGKDSLMTLKDERTEQCFIKQIFLTVSSKLCSAVKNQISRLKRFASDDFNDYPSSLQMHDISDKLEEFNDIPDTFSNIPQKNYPLAITFRKFLMMLDGTLCTSFFDRFYGQLRTHNEVGKSKSGALQAYIATKEVDYEKFSCSYWPHFNAKLTKNLSASTVFTQIISHIKGGNQAGKSTNGKLDRQDYIMLFDRRFPYLSTGVRNNIYDIYLCYEEMKCTYGEFDVSDFVNSLHCRLHSDGYSGDMVDFIYIDEVQDLAMNQISLLKYVCSNSTEGFVFAGDTAQTIASGIDFRFEDVRSLFYTEFLQNAKHGKTLHISDMFQLSQNFRTHCGVLSLAQSIMNLLHYFFPLSVDKLNPETSLIHGDTPLLLESCNGENVLTTIFGGNNSEQRERIMFGADQVILVRDDAIREQVAAIVGEQALVLTILESKGLEFEDVLLYNLFSSSPLRNKWRVVYGYMKKNDIIALSEKISYPEFDGNKHFLLCSELKQLYVAITRTKQRLWICEDDNDVCQPVLDYWKTASVIQVKQVNAPLVKEMQTSSSTDDWRLRGIKLFNERQFGMATMCFQKAGDEYREKLARASDLVASGESLVSTNWRRGQAFLVQAAIIYDSIGKHEKAATCYIKSRDFMKAGLVYLEKCGDSRLEDAGECFAMAKSWLQAAHAYFRAQCYTKCFSMCFKGELFDLGLKFLHQMEEARSFEGPNSSELNAATSKYLQDCASYYFHRSDIRHMMQFVRALRTMDEVRAFLFPRTLLNELLRFEVEKGHFIEAAGTAEHIGSILLWTGTPSFGDATQLILLHAIMNILWTSHVKTECQKGYVGQEQLLKKAREIVQKVSNLYFSASLEADALRDPCRSLANMANNLLLGSTQGNTPVKFFATRSILDIHLLFRPSGYTFELNPILGDVRCSHDVLARNQMSPGNLVYLWNCWKTVVYEALSRVRHVPFRTTGRVSLQHGSNRCRPNAIQDWSSVQNYWTNELYSVGISVLNKLESLAGICSKQAVHPYVQGQIVLAIYEIAKFLRDTKFNGPKIADKSKDFFVLNERRRHNTDDFRKFFALSEHLFFELVFNEWKDESSTLLYILNFPIAAELLLRSLNANVGIPNRRITVDQLRRITTLLLLSEKLNDRMISSLMQYTNRESEYARFFRALKSLLDGSRDGARLLVRSPSVLQSRSMTNWRLLDYASPMCYDYLMKWFGLLAMPYTKTVLTEVLKSWDDGGCIGGCHASYQNLCLDYTAPVHGHIQWPIVGFIKIILSKGSMLQTWIHKTSAIFYLPILLNLVISQYVKPIALQLGDPCEVSDFLSMHGILDVLPQDFADKIRHTMDMRSCSISDFMTAFADAVATMGNRLIVMGLPEGCLTCYDLIACILIRRDFEPYLVNKCNQSPNL